MSAVMAPFGGWIEFVDFDKNSTIPLRFVFELPNQFGPSYITDSLSKFVVLGHILDSQTLNAYHLVFMHNAGRELMLVVTPTVIDTGMHTGYFYSCFVSVFRALFLLRMPTLSFCQTFLILGK